MRLLEIESLGVRALSDGVYRLGEESGEPHPVVVVTGPPSSGATTFLEAIAFTAARLSTGTLIPDPADVLRVGGGAATIRSTWRVDPDEMQYGGMPEDSARAEVSFQRGGLGDAEADPGLLGLMSRYDHDDETSKVVYLPARRLSESSFSLFGSFETEMATARLSDQSAKFAGLPRAIVRPLVSIGDRTQFDAIAAAFAEVCDSAKLIGVASTGEPELALSGGARVPLSRAGFSERNLFVVVACFVVMGLRRSVVLLDTPELGLPVGGATRLVQALASRCTKGQLIVASRDPDLLASTGRSSVITLARGRS